MTLSPLAITVLVAGAAIAGAVHLAGNKSRRRKAIRARIEELRESWADSAPDDRADVFLRLLSEHDESPDADRPGSEAARAEIAFFCGCAHLERHDARPAARMFQIAYHADPKLNTALVLAFACLKVGKQKALGDRPSVIGSLAADRGSPNATLASFETELAAMCAETWRELGRPPLAQHVREQSLLNGMHGPGDVLGHLIANLARR